MSNLNERQKAQLGGQADAWLAEVAVRWGWAGWLGVGESWKCLWQGCQNFLQMKGYGQGLLTSQPNPPLLKNGKDGSVLVLVPGGRFVAGGDENSDEGGGKFRWSCLRITWG